MPHFFQSPGSEKAPQKQLLSAIQAGNSVLANFPLGYPLASVYALSVMMSSGLVVGILPDSRSIHHNLTNFKAGGLRFPEVAFLDGTQMPHEERAIRDAVNRHKVRLLYTTPERFSSLTFLELFVRAEVPFVLIEQAERFLPENNQDFNRYERLRTQGLAAIRQLPPIVLLTAPMRLQYQQALCQLLGLSLDLQSGQAKAKRIQIIETPLPTAHVEIKVAPVWSEHQKFERLIATLAEQPGKGRIGRLHRENPVLIQAGGASQSETLGASLIDYGFESVHIVNKRQPVPHQQHVWQLAHDKPDAIIVNGTFGTEDWRPPSGVSNQLIYWQLPANLDVLMTSLFRYASPGKEKPSTQKSCEEKDENDLPDIEDDLLDISEPSSHIIEAVMSKPIIQQPAAMIHGLLLYTREDYTQALQRIRQNRSLPPLVRQAEGLALRRYRHWVLSSGCRLKGLLQQTLGNADDLAPCGHCDRCQGSLKEAAHTKLLQLVQRVLL